jgi:tetratricopeptide (TPR) repeat protein
MWSPASTDMASGQHEATSSQVLAGRDVWLRFAPDMSSPRAGGPVLLALLAMMLAACESAPTKPTEAASAPVAAGAKPGGAAPVEVTARGKADFDRAVGFMRSGNNTEAELEFKQVALQFPQLAAPYVNLGILYRKTGHLDESEDALKTAVERNEGSAVAWTELGATQRLRGEFPNAAASYEKAIADDPNFAPAYRNLGVVSDLYLGDPERALTAFERYKELTGEEKPVSTWIAELRQRTGKPPLKRPTASAPGSAGSTPAAGTPAAGSDAAPGGTPAGASDATPGASQAAPGASQAAPGKSPPESGGGQSPSGVPQGSSNTPAAAATPPPKTGD